MLRGNLFDPPIMICMKVMIPSGLAVDLLYIFPFKIYWKRRIFPPFPLKQCDPPPAKVLEPTPPPPAINNDMPLEDFFFLANTAKSGYSEMF